MVLNVSRFSTGFFYHEVVPVNDCSTYGATWLHEFNALARPHVSRRDFLGIFQELTQSKKNWEMFSINGSYCPQNAIILPIARALIKTMYNMSMGKLLKQLKKWVQH